jgi:hypothetical protein
MGMEGEPDADIGHLLADFIDMASDDLQLRRCHVAGIVGTFAEIDLEVIAAELLYIPGIVQVLLQRVLEFGGVQILAAAADGAKLQPDFVQFVLERPEALALVPEFPRLVVKRFDAMIAVIGRHLDALFGMRLHRNELMAAGRVFDLVARQRKSMRRGGGDSGGGQAGAQQVSTV